MSKDRFLLTDEDLKAILNTDGAEILSMISRGMPHYYHNEKFYFNYFEVQEWIMDCVELGYIDVQYHNVTEYLEGTLKETLDMGDIRQQLVDYMKKSKGLTDDKFVWLFNNISGDKYVAFYKFVKKFFPGVQSKNMFKYYLALLKTLLDTGTYKDKLNVYRNEKLNLK